MAEAIVKVRLYCGCGFEKIRPEAEGSQCPSCGEAIIVQEFTREQYIDFQKTRVERYRAKFFAR